MGFLYADSSVLVKRHVIETGTSWFQKYARENSIVTARISVVEVFSAFNRRLRGNSIEPSAYKKIAHDFDDLCTSEYVFVEMSEEIIQRARLLLEKHSLRAFDAVQLASALRWHETLQASNSSLTAFLASDKRLLDAAQAEGLNTIDPTEQS